MRAKWLGVVGLLAALGLLVPVGQQIQAQRTALKYGGARVTLAMRDQVGQGMAIGLLAGFRGVVADFLWINNQGYWERKEWIRMYRNMELVTTLQPQAVTFWDTAQWHMAWNIAHAVSSDPANRTKAEGLKRKREWEEKAREFLADGIQNVPNRYELYFAMGWLHWWKLKDPCQARIYFEKAAQFPEAPTYCTRMFVRGVEMCGDREGAYRLWRELWRDGNPEKSRDGINIKNIIERELKRLENDLKLPDEQRIFPVSHS